MAGSPSPSRGKQNGVFSTLQLAIATTLLVFGLVAGSSAFVFASLYVAIGCLLWIGLIVLFYQQ